MAITLSEYQEAKAVFNLAWQAWQEARAAWDDAHVGVTPFQLENSAAQLAWDDARDNWKRAATIWDKTWKEFELQVTA